MLYYIYITIIHKCWVMWYIIKFCSVLLYRGITHDFSKFGKAERGPFAAVTRKIMRTKYGSPEYHVLRNSTLDALISHYNVNSHHPEHFENGINGMDLHDLIELWCDWSAAIRKNKDGNLMNSIEYNEVRFKISPQLAGILRNSVK